MIDLTNEILPKLDGLNFMERIFAQVQYRDTVYRAFGMRVEIRSREDSRHIPHCHINFQNQDLSVSLIDFTEIVGTMESGKREMALRWIKENKEILIEKWKKYHNYSFKL